MFWKFFSKQARKPKGLFGRLYMGRIFKKGNAPLNDLVRESMSIKGSDNILEIGYGPGILIHCMADCLDEGLVEGVDFSETMTAMAQKKNRKHITNGKVKLYMGDFKDMPFDDNSFDKICTVNTVYFWENPQETIEKIHRLLKPGGSFILGFSAREDMKKMPLDADVFNLYSIKDIENLLKEAGQLKDVLINTKDLHKYSVHCAVGRK